MWRSCSGAQYASVGATSAAGTLGPLGPLEWRTGVKSMVGDMRRTTGGHDGHDEEVAVYGTGEAGRIVGLSHGGQVERVVVSADGALENRGSNAATTPSLEERGDARVVRMKRSACSGAEIDGPYELMRLRGAWTARHLALFL